MLSTSTLLRKIAIEHMVAKQSMSILRLAETWGELGRGSARLDIAWKLRTEAVTASSTWSTLAASIQLDPLKAMMRHG